MRKKRFLALVLSAAMVVGNTVAASATTELGDNDKGQQQTVTGSGLMAGTVNKNVFKVVVPAQRANNEADIFDFILDPQELIAATDGVKYISGASVGGKNVSINSYDSSKSSSLYFVNSVNGSKSLSNKSDKFVITNKSTMDIDVSINAKVTPATGSAITVSTDKTFAGGKDKNTNLYIALLDGTNEKETVLSTGNAANYIVTTKIDNADSFYVESQNATGDFTYEIPSVNASGDPESSNQYPEYKFGLTGACNTAADWSSVATSAGAPTVDIIYYLTEHTPKGPSVAKSSYKMQTGTAVTVAINMGDGDKAATSIKEIKYNTASGGQQTLAQDKYTFANNTLTFNASYVTAVLEALNNNGQSSRDYTIEFNEGTKITIALTK